MQAFNILEQKAYRNHFQEYNFDFNMHFKIYMYFNDGAICY